MCECFGEIIKIYTWWRTRMHSSTFGIYKCSRSSVLGITERHINLPIESSCGCVHTIYRHSTHSNIYIRVSWNVSTLSMMYHLHRERNNQVSTSHHSLNIHRILFGSYFKDFFKFDKTIDKERNFGRDFNGS